MRFAIYCSSLALYLVGVSPAVSFAQYTVTYPQQSSVAAQTQLAGVETDNSGDVVPADAVRWGQPVLHPPLSTSNTGYVQNGAYASLLFDSAIVELSESSPCACISSTFRIQLPISIGGPLPVSPRLRAYEGWLQGAILKDADTHVDLAITVGSKTFRRTFPYGTVIRADDNVLDVRTNSPTKVRPKPGIPQMQELPPVNVEVTATINRRAPGASATVFIDTIDLSASFSE